MAIEVPLTLQTAYAELVDRCAADAFADTFSEGEGTFTPKTVNGRRYWYFQVPQADGSRKQRYVGPETPELLDRIKRHKDARRDQRDRRTLVSTLVRSAGLPRPQAEIGQVIEALAAAGVFRFGGVLVGTVAYQTYSAMLGTRLPSAALQTGDVDIAQFRNVSVAIEEEAPPILDTLRKTDPSFRSIPHLSDRQRKVTYQASGGLRVDFLTPNMGPESDTPVALPALGADAQPLRFLDFLIHEPEPAVLLHGVGIHVLVPSPQRYALHKLIVARRRQQGAAKSVKDIRQAEALLGALAAKPHQKLRAVWSEAFGRGPKWRRLLGEGLGEIDSEIRDLTLKLVGANRSVVPDLKLEFAAPAGRYDFDRDVVDFAGQCGRDTVRCAVSREAIEDHFKREGTGDENRLKIFRANRATFEKMAQRKFLHRPVEEPNRVLIKTADVEKLREEIGMAASTGHQ